MFFFRLDADAFTISFCTTESGLAEAIVAIDALVELMQENEGETKTLLAMRKRLMNLPSRGYQ